MTDTNYQNQYSKLPNLVLGFHGCDKSTYDNVLINHIPLLKSANIYDWLGNGIYFWENSFDRALDWAKNNRKIENPAVIGAVIDLGFCLNLTDYNYSRLLARGYELLKMKIETLDGKLPENRKPSGSQDILIRNLDCAVIQQIHEYMINNQDKKDFDSVRGIFIEGKPVYPGAGFMEKTHIQLCIVNPNCIKGYFDPIEYDKKYCLP